MNYHNVFHDVLYRLIGKQLICLAFLFVFYSPSLQASEYELSCDDIYDISYSALEFHVIKNNIDDSFGLIIIERMLSSMDSLKTVFFKEDVEHILLHYSSLVSKQLVKQNCSFIDEIADLYQKRYNSFLIAVNKIIDDLQESDLVLSKDAWDSFDTHFDYIAKADTAKQRERITGILQSQLHALHQTLTSVEKAKSALRAYYENVVFAQSEKRQYHTYLVFIKSVMRSLDAHSDYFSPAELNQVEQQLLNSYVGIGIEVEFNYHYAKVTDIIAGGPADQQDGLKKDDLIIAIAGEEGPFESISLLGVDASSHMIAGEIGTPLRLKILRRTGDTMETKTISLLRDRIENTLNVSTHIYSVQEAASQENQMIGVITIPYFSLGDQSDVDDKISWENSSLYTVLQGLNQLAEKEVTTVVIDLRNNPGGELNEVIKIAGLFLPKTPIVSIKDARDAKLGTSSNDLMFFTGEVVVLVNHLSASASEVFTAAMRDHNRGLVVGSRTYGKGSVQSIYVVPSKGGLNLTTHLFYRPFGSPVQAKGVRPHISFPFLSSHGKIGEKHRENAIVENLGLVGNFQKDFGYVDDQMISELTKFSENRRANSKDFIQLEDLLDQLQKTADDKKKSALIKGYL
ncbi:MAG: S41 family peptidase, partial [Proteobacteria bacterium]|nr:S41 family peptidase [Pseudomonadota bacterium]